MKKAVGGCLIVVLLVLVLGGGALWWFVLRPAWNAGSQFIGAATQLADIAQIEMKIVNRESYAPPTDNVIPADGLARFVAVQQALDAQVGDKLAVLEAKYKELDARTGANGTEPDMGTVIGAYGDLFGLIREAKVAQVDALNAQSMSIEEYRWVRTQAYTSLGIAGADETPAELRGSAMATNADAVRPYRDLLTKTAATAWLGF